jgi:hypothetical protein
MSDSDSVSTDGAESTGAFQTLVIRAWMETGHERRFRARLIFPSEPGDAGSTLITSTPEDVIVAVRDWLANIQAEEGSPQSPPLDDQEL